MNLSKSHRALNKLTKARGHKAFQLLTASKVHFEGMGN